MREFPNDVLLVLSSRGEHDARAECVIREIMAVDKVSWQDAQPRFKEIDTEACKGLGLAKLPYQAAIATAVISGLATFPLCFHLTSVEHFNDAFVLAEHVPQCELETWLEVGSWSWNWMEPPLGQLSFFLLTLQYARSQMQNIGSKPFTERVMQRRADNLSSKFPQYSERVLEEYAKSA